ncbi:MAG: acyl-CoA dehydrogenase family protein [Gammaproteobacteria bacterium]
MNLLLTEEEAILKRGAHEFFAARLPVKSLRALRDSNAAEGFERAAWQEMAELGWAGVLLPESYGGSAMGYKGLGQVLEESGRTLAASPLFATILAGAPLVLAGASEALKQTLLPAVASGECLLALALDEHPRHAPSRIATRAVRSGASYRLNGSKMLVLDGHVADYIVVVARTSGADTDPQGLTLFLLDGDADGLTRTRTHMVDSRNAAHLVMADVEVGNDRVLGGVDQGHALLEPVLDGARAGLAAEMLGSGMEAFERTVSYLKLREQFGQKIGAFQALKHRAALMYCELELTRSAVIAALCAIDESRADIAALASLAKAKACDMLELVTNEAVQLHGGIGMTDDEEIGFFLKRARVQQQIFGDASFHRDRYAALMAF